MDEGIHQKKRDESASCPFRRLIRRHKPKDGSFIPRIVSSLEASVASTRGCSGDISMDSEEFVRDDSALLSLQPWIFKKERYEERRNVGVNRSKGSVRSRGLGGFSVLPVNFMENYITPQLFCENSEVEDYFVASPPNSPAPNLRPFVVTDGTRIISKSSFDAFGLQAENGLCREGSAHEEGDGFNCGIKGSGIGVLPLLESRKLKRKSPDIQHGRVKASDLRKPCEVPQLEGSHDGMLPLSIGISMGMIMTLLLNKIEVEKLNSLLKRTEDLVHDLQDELQMKDSLSVKDLTCATYEIQKFKSVNSKSEESTEMWQNQSLTSYSLSWDECSSGQTNKAGENSESLCKIAAELEAELERLEQNMNACTLEERMSEFDSELVADVVQGELRADKLNRDDTSSTVHTYDAYYCVSPKELSLRLHQVIESRLEERIEELEGQLLQRQQQIQVLKSERASSSQRTLLSNNSDMGLSSDQEETPRGQATRPFCLDISGDALSAYDEAYKELFVHASGKEENTIPITYSNKGDYCADGCKASSSSRRSLPWENLLWSRGGSSSEILLMDDEDDDGKNDDGCTSSTDEEGELFVLQHVEKTRRGSPALTTAQRILFLMDEPVNS